MANKNNTKKGIGIGSLVFAATIVLAGLKLAGVIEISWLGVFIPFLIWAGIVAILALVLAATKAFVKKNMTDKQRFAYTLGKGMQMDDNEALQMALKMK